MDLDRTETAVRWARKLGMISVMLATLGGREPGCYGCPLGAAYPRILPGPASRKGWRD